MSKLKTSLVTGNSRFIGSEFVRQYNAQHRTVGLDLMNPENEDLLHVQYIGDVCNKGLLDDIMDKNMK